MLLDHFNKLEHENQFLFKIASEISTLSILNDLILRIFDYTYVMGYFKPQVWVNFEREGILDQLLFNDYYKVYDLLDTLWKNSDLVDNDLMYRPTSFRDDLNKLQKEAILSISGLEQSCSYWEMTEYLLNSLKNNDQLEKDRIHEIIRRLIHKKGLENNLPETLKRELKSKYVVVTPWYAVLERYLQEMMVSDWLWLPPNRRYINDNLFFPTTKKKNFKIYIGIKCKDFLNNLEIVDELIAEIYNIISTIFSFELRLIGFHNDILFDILLDDTSYSHEISDVSMQNFYYTNPPSFKSLFDYISSLPDVPDLLVIFTRVSTAPDSLKPDYQVLWVTLYSLSHYFGDSILFNDDTELKSWDYIKKRSIEDENKLISSEGNESITYQESTNVLPLFGILSGIIIFSIVEILILMYFL